jgi:hypothetical protein
MRTREGMGSLPAASSRRKHSSKAVSSATPMAYPPATSLGQCAPCQTRPTPTVAITSTHSSLPDRRIGLCGTRSLSTNRNPYRSTAPSTWPLGNDVASVPLATRSASAVVGRSWMVSIPTRLSTTPPTGTSTSVPAAAHHRRPTSRTSTPVQVMMAPVELVRASTTPKTVCSLGASTACTRWRTHRSYGARGWWWAVHQQQHRHRHGYAKPRERYERPARGDRSPGECSAVGRQLKCQRPGCKGHRCTLPLLSSVTGALPWSTMQTPRATVIAIHRSALVTFKLAAARR